ncbi:unnamed protein product [Clonostachys rhizophaga]|uniref:Uncharacterized protein n=1 Tax=Clonostachys rhizophaga TaxID=160324 RepID=A0A9N9VGV0_9HYPO|nr:unnamed protein product [Clonostachys rhizophaga]
MVTLSPTRPHFKLCTLSFGVCPDYSLILLCSEADKITNLTASQQTEIARTRPDLIHTLAGSWDMEVYVSLNTRCHFAMSQLISCPGVKRATDNGWKDRFSTYYHLLTLLPKESLSNTGDDTSADIPPITEVQAEALDTLHFIGGKFCVNTEF